MCAQLAVRGKDRNVAPREANNSLPTPAMTDVTLISCTFLSTDPQGLQLEGADMQMPSPYFLTLLSIRLYLPVALRTVAIYLLPYPHAYLMSETESCRV